jgi:2-polyprenyl-3-methyl-5-hydroxy-6-metoxy-1,4-benzoquinol methylase
MPPVPTVATSHQRFEIQAGKYSFPYHWLPHVADNRWTIHRTLHWGFEYLALLETLCGIVLRLQPTRVLDLGCGDGRLSFQVAKGGVETVVGIDPVGQAIAFARAFCADLPQTTFVCGDLRALQGGNFDVIVAMEVLEHVPSEETPALLREVRRRLHPGGRLVVSVPTTNLPLNPKHERHYTLDLLKAEVAPWFHLTGHCYVHQLTLHGRLVRRLVTNRFAVLAHPTALRVVGRYYRRYIQSASAATGAHLVAVMAPKEARPNT